MIKEADFNLSEQTIKNIVNTREVINANMQKLNVKEEDLKLENNIIKLYSDEIYVKRMENVSLEVVKTSKLDIIKNCIKKILGLRVFNSFSKLFLKKGE